MVFPVTVQPLPDWPRAHGSPLFNARLRSTPNDFQVMEQLGWEFSGDGEHDYLWVEKTGANTEWVARQLALHAGVPPRDVGIERFEWLAHTHPLEMASDHASVSRGATAQDRIALERIHEVWGQTRSTVVVCRGGRVEQLVDFRIERDQRSPYGRDGELWTPSP